MSTARVRYTPTATERSPARAAGTTSFTAKTTTPTVEDNGTGHLVGGIATISLEPAFEHSIDTRQTYQVMLTPDGDTKGLFVANKTANGFVVREVQGGRGSLDFDYHIYAIALGQAGQHMTELTRAQAAQIMPHSAAVSRQMSRPSIPMLHPR